MYLLSEEISLEDLLSLKKDWDGDTGSMILFAGIVRRDKKEGGDEVEGIFYESYSSMAEEEIGRIEEEAKRSFPIHKVWIRHRIGYVPAGEISFLVMVESPHREEGFKAIQFIIDEVKKRVPIWKRERLLSGKEIWR